MALQGFDQTYYLGVKLAQLQSNPPTADEWADKTTADVEAAFQAANLTAEQHYTTYGYTEGLAPNAFFVPREYELAKGMQLMAANPGAYPDLAAAAKAFTDAWNGNVYDHYLQYGAAEDINPSNDFDNSAYYASKLAELQGKGNTDYQTVDELKAYFESIGMTPLGHYVDFGEDEGVPVTPVPEDEQVDPDTPVNPGGDFTLTAGTDILLAPGAELPEGVTEEEVKRTTDRDDMIEGVSSALSSARTLNPEDSIDGAKGNDLLKVDMQGNFSGFTTAGGVTNVETIELTNSGTITRTFDATGVEGDVNYVVNAKDATVNLTDLGSVGAITLNGQSSGSFSAKYATDVTKGTDDTLALTLHDVGTVKTDSVAEKAVSITAAGIEEAVLTSNGTANVVDLSGLSATKYTVSGAGNLKVNDTVASLATFDAAALTGDLDLAVDASKAVKNATLQGGSGDDTLTLSGSGTVQYAMSAIETVAVDALSGVMTFSAANASGLETILAKDGLNQNTTFASLGSSDLTVQLQGANANTSTLSLDHSGSTILMVDTPASTATTTTPSVNKLNVTAVNSSSVNMDVAEKMDYQGVVTATTATSVELSINGETSTGADIKATKATSVVIDAVANASQLKLTTSKATDLNITAAAALTLTGSTLDAVESLTANTDGLLEFGTVNLAKVAAVNLSGTGSADLNNLGSTTLDYGLTVTASGLSSDKAASSTSLTTGTINTKGHAITVDASGVVGAVTLGAISAANGATTAGDVTVNLNGTGGNATLGAITGKSVTVDASGALGSMTYGGAISVADTLTFKGSSLNANDLSGKSITPTGTSLTASLTGGLGNDQFKITSVDANETATITLTGDLGLGTNSVIVDAGAETTTGVTINLSGLDVGTSGTTTVTGGALADTITGTSGADTITGGKGDDTLVGGAGADIFTFSTSGNNGKDSISDFVVDSDKLNVVAMTAGTGSAATEITSAGAADTAIDRKDFVQVINTDGSAASVTTAGTATLDAADFTAATLTDVAAFLAEKFTGVSSTTDGDTGVYVINYTASGSTSTYVYQWDNNTNADVVQADELSLVGVVTRDAVIDNGDLTVA
ncbi:beta strand repeat-containing protein [Marichromatium bheemlicum]|uniref:Uncharacterized protein n=1 Tax=Marichromatium bheemlicum TaxID=365339 RepID=A0ABX1I5A2_9GAMM|nr:hypothetical protein [Marichromatium bheemlicum]NKN32752.1 hypothetical protein [Marichromatium bheemlicum]